MCPYKGFARYWSVQARGADGRRPDLAWNYPAPFPGLDAVAGRIAFLDEAVDTIVDGVLQRRPRTQWSDGIRANTRGGGSGFAQAAHGGEDHSIVARAAT